MPFILDYINMCPFPPRTSFLFEKDYPVVTESKSNAILGILEKDSWEKYHFNSCIWVIPCQINQESAIISQIFMKFSGMIGTQEKLPELEYFRSQPPN